MTERVSISPAGNAPTTLEILTQVERVAAQFGNNPALVTDQSTVSYRQLWSRAQIIAQAIEQQVSGGRPRVLLAISKGPELVCSMLATWLCGGCYLTIESDLPMARVEQITAVFQPDLLIEPSGDALGLNNVERAVTAVIDDHDSLQLSTLSVLTDDPTPVIEQPGYVVTTSGSTGAPRLIIGRAAGVAHFVDWQRGRFAVNDQCICSWLAPASFDVGLRELFLPLTAGGTVVVPAPRLQLDPAGLLRWLEQRQVSHLHIVPTLLRQLLAIGRQPLASLQMVLSAGEPLLGRDVRELRKRLLPASGRLINLYGPSETTLAKLYLEVGEQEFTDEQIVPLGYPLPDSTVRIIDAAGDSDQSGEIGISTLQRSAGYLGDAAGWAEKLIVLDDGLEYFRTGDRGRIDAVGQVHFLGRKDRQIKLAGRRIELNEIEAALLNLDEVNLAAVTSGDVGGTERLIAAVQLAPKAQLRDTDVRNQLGKRLPPYMVPSSIFVLTQLPRTVSGKLDRRALLAIAQERFDAPVASVSDSLRRQERAMVIESIVAAWREVAGIRLAPDQGYFEQGGTSLDAITVAHRLSELLGHPITAVDLIEHPTAHRLAESLAATEDASSAERSAPSNQPLQRTDIAIIGMACRAPGASNPDELWRLIQGSNDALSRFEVSELDAIDQKLLKLPNYVRVRGVVDAADQFDPALFGLSRSDASMMDPQHRLFLLVSREALDVAGYLGHGGQRVGVFAGTGDNSYFSHQLTHNAMLQRAVSEHQLRLLNEKDYLSVRVAHCLDLHGPALSINTACSTSLVCVTAAVKSLLAGECELALAGGSFMHCPQRAGYLAQEGGFASASGVCRPFDATADGTVFSDGAGAVLLKPLAAAVRDGDHIHAVIKGHAINNDGARKLSFMAPSVDGQARVIKQALDNAGVNAHSVGYVETHGTGTPLGDPAEFRGLSEAYGGQSALTCYLSSIKGHIGHTDAAAGVLGLIKAAMAVERGAIPPIANYSAPNPQLPLEQSRFALCKQPVDWSDSPLRRAGISSFGVGGTNAHVVIEQPPAVNQPMVDPLPFAPQTLLFDAASTVALEQRRKQLAEYLAKHPQRLSDVAYSLHRRPRLFAQTAAIHVGRANDLAQQLSSCTSTRLPWPAARPRLVLGFAGQGTQQLAMGQALADAQPEFAHHLAAASNAVAKHWSHGDLRQLLWHSDNERLTQTEIAQPAIFAMQYALGRTLLDWGVEPDSWVGHSVGEFAVSVLNETMDLEGAAKVVVARGAIMQSMAPGAMLSVPLGREALSRRLPAELDIAAINAPRSIVVAGENDAVRQFQTALAQEDVSSRILRTSHAFHSRMMKPGADRFRDVLDTVSLQAGRRSVASTVRPDDGQQAMATPDYWVDQLTQPVLFADAMARLQLDPTTLLVDVGPMQVLSAMARQNLSEDAQPSATLVALSPAKLPNSEARQLTESCALLARAGVAMDAVARPPKGRFLRLPAYPYQMSRCWVDRDDEVGQTSAGPEGVTQRLLALLQASTAIPASEIAVDSSFPELGLDSLSLTEFGVSVQREFGVAVTLAQLLNRDFSIAQLQSRIEAEQPVEANLTATSQKRPTEVGDNALFNGSLPDNWRLIMASTEFTDNRDYRRKMLEQTMNELQADTEVSAELAFSTLNSPQREVWASSQFNSDASRAFNLLRAIELTGETFQAEAMQKALDLVVARHDSLRMGFDETGGHPVRLPSFELEVIDARALEQTATERAVVEQHRRLAEWTFDLTCAPLLKVVCMLTEETQTQLLLVGHHIVCDGWSMRVLLHELGQFYGLFANGVKPRVDKPNRIAELMAHENSAEQASMAEAAVDYWCGQFADGYPSLDLPLDRSRPAQRSYAIGNVHLVLEADLTRQLEALSRRSECTFFTTAYAIWSLVLMRLAGTQDLVMGIPAANQAAGGLTQLIAHCVNLLPVRCQRQPEQRFVDYLRSLQATLIDSYEHQQLTFGELVARQPPARDPARVPVVPVTFNCVHEQADLEFGSLRLTSHPIERRFGSFELEFNLTRLIDGRIELDLAFNRDLFSSDTARRWLEHFAHAVRQVGSDPDQRLSRVALFSEAQWEGMARRLRGPQRSIAPTQVFEQVAATAEQSPNRLAVLGSHGATTYGQLQVQANSIAAQVAEHTDPGDCVGLYLQRSPEMVAAALGIWQAGCAYVPLDPAFPEARLAHYVKSAELPLVLTTTDLIARASSWSGPVLFDITSCTAVEGSVVRAVPDTAPAYVIFTSGSTGKPKGVVIPHRALNNFVLAMIDEPGISSDDRVLALTTLSFDISVLELWGTLVASATVVLADADESKDPDAIVSLMNEHEVTIAQATPAMWRALLNIAWPTEFRLEKLLTGGEPLPTDLLPPMLARAAQVWNMYGPTETTVWSTCARLTDADAPIGIGRPILNTSIFVLDELMQPVPTGAVGTLFIGGLGVAAGYLGQPELSAERFIVNPLSEDPEDLIYDTGDLARSDAEGQLQHLGRADAQVKIRGFRIELGEIEHQLGRLAGVASCAANVVELAPGDQRLLAYYVPSDAPLATDWRDVLRTNLPDYMVPQRLVEIPTLPLTPNRKIDRKALPLPDKITGDNADSALPLTETEQALSAIWSQLIGTTDIGRDATFFDVGGHSLLALQAINQIEEQWNKRLQPQQLVMSSLAHLANLLVPDDAPVAEFSSSAPAVVIDSFYFGPDKALFGVVTRPANRTSSRAALICSPYGHEYMRVHRVLQHLSNQLAAAGVTVMRFDYAGTADSMGDFTAASLGSMKQDALTAYRHLTAETNYESVAVLGVRLGANIALSMVKEAGLASPLVLWEPWLHGAEQLASLQEMHRLMLIDRKRFLRRRRHRDPAEILGFGYSDEMLAQLGELSIDGASLAGRKLMLVGSDCIDPLSELAEANGSPVLARIERPDDQWCDLSQLELLLLPSPQLRELTDVLTSSRLIGATS